MKFSVKSRKFQLGVAAAFVVGAAAMVTTVKVADAAVTEVNPACSNATAVLLVGTKENAAESWTRVKSFFENKRVWLLGPMVQGSGSPSQLTQWDVAQFPGGPDAAFTVRCGAGGTCNEIAKLFGSDYKDMKPSPYVFCGESVMFSNPVAQ